MPTIPITDLVSTSPSVIGAGGSAIDIIGLALSSGPRTPIGSVLSFPSEAAVLAYYGAGSPEDNFALGYFKGFTGSNKKPGSMLLAQYPTRNLAAWLRGRNISTMTLATLQSLNALLNVTIDGVLKTATINLAAATSFANAAELIAFAL